nr:hypothetical protein [Tanacetum cinerariifolium]
MLNPISDVGVKSIFTTTSSPIVSLETPTPIMTPSTITTITTSGVKSIFTTTSSPFVSLETPTPIITPSTITTITTSGEAPIPPPTIPSIILENVPTFNSAFCFEERLRLLETSFSEYRQTNQFADAVSVIPGIVHQYMDQQMKEAVREAIQIQTDRLQDSLQRENDEFLRNNDENMKKVLKGLVKNQLTYQKWNSRRSLLKRWKEISLSSDSMNNKTFTRRSQSRQQSASESAYAEEPVQTTCQMEEIPLPVYETGADDQPIVQTS